MKPAAQWCQSAPTALITGNTQSSATDTRDAGQQTSELHFMPSAAVTETVWTFSDQDATETADAECLTPGPSTSAAGPQPSPEMQGSKVRFATDNEDIYEDWSESCAAATKVCMYTLDGSVA